MLSASKQVFFELLRVGLWADVNGNDNLDVDVFKDVDWGEVYRLAEEQSVIGLIAEAIERFKSQVPGFKIPQEWALQFIGQTLQIEQRNKAMNEFVAKLITLLRKNDIYAILVKGQGIAQCYEKPLWRASGDVDLLLSDTNYEKVKALLLPLATEVETEYKLLKHLGMTMKGGFVVELHGLLHSRLSKRVDRVIDGAQREEFYGGKVRSWMVHGEGVMVNSSSRDEHVFLPAQDEDVVFVFTHILHHFFFEGIGLRQICDWCRLLWTYRDSLNHGLLESRLRKAGLMTEWKAFAAFAVKYLGMLVEAVPLFNENDNKNEKLKRKVKKICDFVMEVGNFGHNKMVPGSWTSQATKSSAKFQIQGYFRRKFVSSWGRFGDMLRHFSLFPMDSIVFFGGVLRSGLHAAVRGE